MVGLGKRLGFDSREPFGDLPDSDPGNLVGLSASVVFEPTKEFHTARHTLFSADENMEIEKVVPFAASVKTKLGKGGSAED